MADERNFGVTEARVGLTLLTCLLIALGFAILRRLDSPTTVPRVDAPSNFQPSDGYAATPPVEPSADENAPQVLPTQSGAPTSVSESQLVQQPFYSEDYATDPHSDPHRSEPPTTTLRSRYESMSNDLGQPIITGLAPEGSPSSQATQR